MKWLRHRRPSVSTMLGITKAKKSANNALGITALMKPFRAKSHFERKIKRDTGYYSEPMKAARAVSAASNKTSRGRRKTGADTQVPVSTSPRKGFLGQFRLRRLLAYCGLFACLCCVLPTLVYPRSATPTPKATFPAATSTEYTQKPVDTDAATKGSVVIGAASPLPQIANSPLPAVTNTLVVTATYSKSVPLTNTPRLRFTATEPATATGAKIYVIVTATVTPTVKRSVYTPIPSKQPAATSAPVIPTQPPQQVDNGNTCPGFNFTCSQLTCTQAYACLAAGNGKLDNDKDGKPCETQCGR